MITHTIASGKHSQLLKPWPSRKFVDLPMKNGVSLHSYVCLPKGRYIYIYITPLVIQHSENCVFVKMYLLNYGWFSMAMLHCH